MLTVDIPAEPEDGSVVLDRHADAWQRRGTWWVSATSAQNEQPWGHLLVDYGPLALMIAESAVDEDVAAPDEGERYAEAGPLFGGESEEVAALRALIPSGPAFLRHVAGGPTVVSRRAMRDEPQA